MGLAILIIGLVVFLGAHVFVTRREARSAAIARLGEGPYKGLFSLVSLAGLVLIVWGFAHYRGGQYVQVWSPPSWMRHITVALVWPSIILIVAAYIPGNIRAKLKHPMLAGVKLWAFAHLLSNGDLGGIILFGAVLAWAVFDRITLKRRSDPGVPPFVAGADGGMRNDVIAVVVGTVLYALRGLSVHPLVLGLPVFSAHAMGT